MILSNPLTGQLVLVSLSEETLINGSVFRKILYYHTETTINNGSLTVGRTI